MLSTYNLMHAGTLSYTYTGTCHVYKNCYIQRTLLLRQPQPSNNKQHTPKANGKEGKPATDVMGKWGKGPRTWKNATKKPSITRSKQ